jgi:uncharacterized protein with gpF-like domain
VKHVLRGHLWDKDRFRTAFESYNNENKNYNTVGTVPKSNRKIVERGKIVLSFCILNTLIA